MCAQPDQIRRHRVALSRRVEPLTRWFLQDLQDGFGPQELEPSVQLITLAPLRWKV